MLEISKAAPAAVPYVYVLVREDLTCEQQLVQAAHATLAAGARFGPIRSDTHLVVLAVRDEPALLAASHKLLSRGLAHELFFEPDGGVGYSALATRTLLRPEERRMFRNWQLLRQRRDTPVLAACPSQR